MYRKHLAGIIKHTNIVRIGKKARDVNFLTLLTFYCSFYLLLLFCDAQNFFGRNLNCRSNSIAFQLLFTYNNAEFYKLTLDIVPPTHN